MKVNKALLSDEFSASLQICRKAFEVREVRGEVRDAGRKRILMARSGR